MIKSQFKQFASTSAIYGISGILNGMISFLLTPLYANTLTPEDYAFLTILTITSTFAATFLQLGIGSAIHRSILQREIDKRIVLSTAFFFNVVVTLVGIGGFILFAPRASELLFGAPDPGGRYLAFALMAAALDAMTVTTYAQLRVEERAIPYSLVSAFNFTLGLTLNIIFVVVLRQGVSGILMAALLRAVVHMSITLALLLPAIKLTFSLPELSDLLSFGLPLVPVAMASLILSVSDRYFLQFFTTSTDVGIYSLGYKVGSFLQLPVAAIQITWPTIMFRILKFPEAKEFYSRVLTYYMLLAGSVALAMTVFGREIIMLIAKPEFFEAWKIIPFAALAQLCSGAHSLTIIGLYSQKKTVYIMIAWLAATGVHLAANFILIPKFGMLGAAVSSLIAYAIVFAVALAASLRFYDVPYQVGRILKLAAVLLGVFLAGEWMSASLPLWPAIFVKSCLLALIPGILLVAGFFETKEVEFIRLRLRSLNHLLARRANP